MQAESNSSFMKTIFLCNLNYSEFMSELSFLGLRHFSRILAFLSKFIPHSLSFLFKSGSKQLENFSDHQLVY